MHLQVSCHSVRRKSTAFRNLKEIFPPGVLMFQRDFCSCMALNASPGICASGAIVGSTKKVEKKIGSLLKW